MKNKQKNEKRKKKKRKKEGQKNKPITKYGRMTREEQRR